MAKEVSGLIKLQINGGAANPSPPVGPALGAKGVNIMDQGRNQYGRTTDPCPDRGFRQYRRSPPVLSRRIPESKT